MHEQALVPPKRPNEFAVTARLSNLVVTGPLQSAERPRLIGLNHENLPFEFGQLVWFVRLDSV